MKKIVIDARFLTRKQRGMPAYVAKLCASIPHKMPEVHFTLLVNKQFEHNDEQENYTNRLDALSKIENVSIININAEDERSWELFKLPSFLRKHKHDLLHMPTNRVCMLTTTPQISTVHDCMEWKYLDQNHGIPKIGTWKTKFYHWRKRAYAKLNYVYGVAKKANLIITVSNYAKNSIHETFGVDNNKIIVCYHGLPDGFDSAHGLPLSARQGVLMLGGESYQKNCENAIAAYSSLPKHVRERHRLVICGSNQSPNSLISQAINKTGIRDTVDQLSWVTTEDLVKYFTLSRAFLFVSREEGFGFPLLQALYCETPTVISDADVLREIAGENYPNASMENSSEMTNILQRLLEDDNYWLSISDESKAASNTFNWNESINTHIDAYKKVMFSQES